MKRGLKLKLRLFFAYFFSALAVIFFSIAAYKFITYQSLIRGGLQAKGQVVGIQDEYRKIGEPMGKRGRKGPPIHWFYRPIVQFTATNGQEVKFTSRFSYPKFGDTCSWTPNICLNATENIVYSAKNPAVAEIERLIQTTGNSQIKMYLVLAVLTALVGGYEMYRVKKLLKFPNEGKTMMS